MTDSKRQANSNVVQMVLKKDESQKSATSAEENQEPAAQLRVAKRAHVGVVGSGDMEVLLEPSPDGGAHAQVLTRRV